MEEDLDIDINIEKLISLIKDQPAVYDKTLPPLDQKEKQNLWFNICKELVPGWEERQQLEKTQIGIKVYSRWKNLRTCFRREYYLQKEEAKAHRHGNPFIQKKRKTYEFYDQLLFLLPTEEVKKYFSNSTSPQESVPKDRKMTSRAVSPIVFDDNPTSASVNIPGINLPSIQISRVDPDQAPLTSGPRSYPFPPAQPAHPFAPGQATQPVPPCQAAQQNVPRPTVDEDRHFLLSILPALQRMSRSQKLKAKMKFLQALSDVDAENRETLQRYVCFTRRTSDQDCNVPEPITGTVRPCFMQADHSYFLVRGTGNKRVRMMRPESANTDPHQKFENGLYQDLVTNNLPETAEDAKSDETAEFGSLQQTADNGNLQENLDVENVQETIEVGGSQEPVEIVGSQDTVVFGNVEKSVAVEVVGSKDTVKDAGSKDTVELGSSKDTVEDAGSKDTVEVGGSKDTVEDAGSKDKVEVGGSKGTVEDGNIKKTDEVGLQDNIKVGNVQVPAEVGNLEDNVEVFSLQENVETSGELMDIAVAKHELMLEMAE